MRFLYIAVDLLDVEVRVLADGHGLFSEVKRTIGVQFNVSFDLVSPANKGRLPQLPDMQVPFGDAFFDRLVCGPIQHGFPSTLKGLDLFVLSDNFSWDDFRNLQREDSVVDSKEQQYPDLAEGRVTDAPCLPGYIPGVSAAHCGGNFLEREALHTLLIVDKGAARDRVVEHLRDNSLVDRNTGCLNVVLNFFETDPVVHVDVDRLEQPFHAFVRDLQWRITLVQVLRRTIVTSRNFFHSLGRVWGLGSGDSDVHIADLIVLRLLPQQFLYVLNERVLILLFKRCVLGRRRVFLEDGRLVVLVRFFLLLDVFVQFWA